MIANSLLPDAIHEECCSSRSCASDDYVVYKISLYTHSEKNIRAAKEHQRAAEVRLQISFKERHIQKLLFVIYTFFCS